MTISKLTHDQRQRRQMMRNAYLIESTDTIREAMTHYHGDNRRWLQELLDECEKHNVDNFGDVPM